jgi:hypothetical protein
VLIIDLRTDESTAFLLVMLWCSLYLFLSIARFVDNVINDCWRDDFDRAFWREISR